MKFLYRVSDFYKLITEGYLYIDRTTCLPVLEEAGDACSFYARAVLAKAY